MKTHLKCFKDFVKLKKVGVRGKQHCLGDIPSKEAKEECNNDIHRGSIP